MDKLSQNKINKILIAVIVMLVIFTVYSRVTERKRINQAVCVYSLTNWGGTTDFEQLEAYCIERNK